MQQLLTKNNSQYYCVCTSLCVLLMLMMLVLVLMMLTLVLLMLMKFKLGEQQSEGIDWLRWYEEVGPRFEGRQGQSNCREPELIRSVAITIRHEEPPHPRAPQTRPRNLNARRHW